MFSTIHAGWMAIALSAAGAAQAGSSPKAYYDGEVLKLRFMVSKHQRPLTVGPWRMGSPIRSVRHGRPDRISDKRSTLYFVVPGSQYQSGAVDLDHNLIVNTAPLRADPLDAELDLFWVIVLDPALNAELRSETDLIMLAQERFLPGDLFALDDAPGAGLLREVFRATALLDLKRYRQRNGTFPRILILPANLIQSATIER